MRVRTIGSDCILARAGALRVFSCSVRKQKTRPNMTHSEGRLADVAHRKIQAGSVMSLVTVHKKSNLIYIAVFGI